MSFWKKLFRGKPSEQQEASAKPPVRTESTSVTPAQKTDSPKVKAESIVEK